MRHGRCRFGGLAEGTAGDGGLGAWGHTIGSAWGDFDNDGHFDLFVGNFSHPPAYQDRAKFLRNKGASSSISAQGRSSAPLITSDADDRPLFTYSPGVGMIAEIAANYAVISEATRS